MGAGSQRPDSRQRRCTQQAAPVSYTHLDVYKRQGVAGDVGKAVSRIADKLHPGAIVLLHEGAPHGNNLAIIEGVLLAMRERGYQAVLPAPH